MPLHLLNSALKATERGYVPDVAIRYGIRRLLRQRLDNECSGTCEDWQHRFADFVAEARCSPIALVPDVANEQHYEVPAEFFTRALGSRLKYSCCHWSTDTESLDQAEDASLAITCQRAEIEDGMKILDLGCGWGSVSLWVAEKFPNCQVTAASNSSAQKSFIDQRARTLGLSNLHIITADMNDLALTERFDRVVSVEMFEHMRNHEELLRRISNWLTPAGKLFVHIFCNRQFTYQFETAGAHNWMGRHFFTGGIMPSDDLLLHYQSDMKLANQWRWNGSHYAKTCNAWLLSMDRQRLDIMSIFRKTYGDEAGKWFVRWRLFFMACAELFAFNGGDEWWVSHYLFENRKQM